MRYRLLRAFTLIELLIVVAIIGILAAMAVPNFLQAQTRAKVAAARADMRTLGLHAEAYRIDAGDYPFPAGEDGRQYSSPLSHWAKTRTSMLLSTPVAYLSSLPEDPFQATGSSQTSRLFHYSTRDYASLFETGLTEYDGFVNHLTNRAGSRVPFMLLSFGPDRDQEFSPAIPAAAPLSELLVWPPPPSPDDPIVIPADLPEPVLYDPTNGTVSSGDILYWGTIGQAQ